MDVLVNLTVGIISQCVFIPNHQVVHLKYILILLVDYISVNLGKYHATSNADIFFSETITLQT